MENTESRITKQRRQNPLTFYLRTLLYMFMALVMRLVAFLPLGALLLFPAGSPFRWAAVLCPVLLIFFILPLRFSFAQALVQPARDRRFSFDVATGVSGYGEKLAESLLHALHIIKWGIPLGAMLGAIYYFYNNTDMITVMKGLSEMGAGVVTGWSAVANFFIGIFGGAKMVPNGGIMEGLYTIGVVLAIGVLILLWGAVRNSAYRFVWASATRAEKNPHAEARRRLRGRRWKQLGVALLNLILWAPALFVVATTLKEVAGGMSEALYGFIATKKLSMPELSNALYPLLFAFVVCYMPLLPVRRMLTAFFATRTPRHVAVESQTEPEAIEPVAVVSTASGAQMPVETDIAAAAQQLPVTQVYAPFAQPVQSESTYVQQEPALQPEQEPANMEAPVAAYEPTPTPEAIPAYQPVAEPVVDVQPEPIAEVEPVMAYEPIVEVEPMVEVEPIIESEPFVEAEPVIEVEPAQAVVAQEPEATPMEAMNDTTEDFYAIGYQPEGTVAVEPEESTLAQDDPWKPSETDA